MPKTSSAATPRRESPRSAVRILQILEKLGEQSEGWTLSALSRELATPKSSLLVLLRALGEKKHVRHVDGVYHLDEASFRLASRMLSNRRFPEVARPILQSVVQATGETAVIGVMSEDRASTTYIDKVESENALRFSAKIGDRRPLYASAAGHVFLAFGDPAQAQAYLKSVIIKPLTSNAIATRQELKQAIELVREQGIAVTKDQATQGVTGFGAPIFDETGTLIASLVLAAPSTRIEFRLDEIGQLAKQAAADISSVMGYRG